MAMSWGKVTTLTSEPAYPGILFPEPFGPERGLGEVLTNSKCLGWWATQGLRRALPMRSMRGLVHTVLVLIRAHLRPPPAGNANPSSQV